MLRKEYCMRQRLAIKKKKKNVNPDKIFLGWKCAKKKKKRKSKNGLKKKVWGLRPDCGKNKTQPGQTLTRRTLGPWASSLGLPCTLPRRGIPPGQKAQPASALRKHG